MYFVSLVFNINLYSFQRLFIPLIHFPHSTVSSLTCSSLRWVFLVFPNHVFIMNRFQHKRNVLKYVFLFICLLTFFFTLVFALKIIFYFSQVSFVIEDKTENIECARRKRRRKKKSRMLCSRTLKYQMWLILCILNIYFTISSNLWGENARQQRNIDLIFCTFWWMWFHLIRRRTEGTKITSIGRERE